MNKIKKTGLIISGAISTALAAGVAVPLVNSALENSSVSTNTNNNGNNGGSSINQETMNFTTMNNFAYGENLTFRADSGINLNSNVNLMSKTVNSNQTGPERTLTTVTGEKKTFKVTTQYENNRKYMPILAYDENISYNNYSQTREYKDVIRELFPGWTRTHDQDLTSKLKTRVKSSDGMDVYKYQANDILKSAFTLEDTEITYLVINLQDAEQQVSKSDFKTRFEEDLKTIQPHFVSISGVNDWNKGMIADLSVDKNLKKLTIWDTWGTLTDMSGITIPNTVKELEIRSDSLKKINPLQIPDNAAIIHESSLGAKFEFIDMSSQGKMTTEELQKAVDIVYKNRIKERAFQGAHAGGYIPSWSLRKTGLMSFNSVTIPPLQDGTGRFYIAYVAVESDAGSSGTSSEIITEGNTPSNDSNIGEWFDWNADGWNKVETVIVNSKEGKPLNFDKTVKEIIGFLNKYPNVKKIDVQSLTFVEEGKEAKDLEAAVKEAYTGDPAKLEGITFIVSAESK